MIKVYFECTSCRCTDGRVFAHDRTVEVECIECGKWESLEDKYPEPNTVKRKVVVTDEAQENYIKFISDQ